MSDQENSGWCTILSDPAVFTDLLSDIGVKHVQVEELYSLDRSLFESLAPIHGLVFLFRYRSRSASGSASNRPGKILNPSPSNIFFARQVVNNACATQAILSIVFNSRTIDIGPELSFFREFTSSFSASDRGLAISNSEVLRSCHNSFAPQHQFVVESNPFDDSEKEEPYHFVSYIPVDGKVYELDGLQPGPLEHGAYGGDAGDWLDVVSPVIGARMAEYSDEGEIRFNLLAVVEDIGVRLTRELDALPADSPEREDIINRISAEADKRAQWKRDNERRKFNFVPFIVETLKATAEAGLIDGIIERATERRRSQLAAQSASKNLNSSSD
jgi:ubiquitin carboxyl-terminal hydrolase L5